MAERIWKLGLVLTHRCNARCAHCAVVDESTPAVDMPLEDALSYVSQLADLSNGRFALHLTGGECLVVPENLLAVVRRASALGALGISLVSNGYWGTSEAEAVAVAEELRAAGLTDISFSVDDFHAAYVPRDRVLNALLGSVSEGIRVGIKCVVAADTGRVHDIMREWRDHTLGMMVKVEEIPYIPMAEHDGRGDILLDTGAVKEPCPFNGYMVIQPDGATYPCCSPGWTDRLCLGNARERGLAALFEEARRNSLYRVLRSKGPGYFLTEEQSNDGYSHLCHVCRVALEENEAAYVDRVLSEWRRERVRVALS